MEARGFYYVGLKLINFEYLYIIQINKNDWIFFNMIIKNVFWITKNKGKQRMGLLLRQSNNQRMKKES